jgi:hypothetical protein
MLPSSEVEPEHRGALAEIQETITPQKDSAPIRRLAFKLYDKKGALDSMSKVLGMQRDSGASVNQQTLNALIAVVYALLEKHVPQQKLEPVVIELGRAIDGVFQQ